MAQNQKMALHLFRTQEELIKLMATIPYDTFGKMRGGKNRELTISTKLTGLQKTFRQDHTSPFYRQGHRY